MKKFELLAPAGDFEKLETALNFGADAVYLAGKKFGLRTFAGNFDEEEMKRAVELVHSKNKKIYITLNILAHNEDFNGMAEYVKFLSEIKVDAVIVSDIGIMELVKNTVPEMEIHVSTQANITNLHSAKVFEKLGAKRLILARELSIEEIKEIKKHVNAEIECFVHGAMCISYSGRCLLSNYLTGRDSNRGACVQACRWEYLICEKSRKDGGEKYILEEDEKGTYILNSKDLNMLPHLKQLMDAGVTSFKIEGRMKSPYYVANVVNSYRRAIDLICAGKTVPEELEQELIKSSHRNYTTGFFFGAKDKENFESSYPVQTHEFMALVLEDAKDGEVLIEQRNRFKESEELEVLSPNKYFNSKIIVRPMVNLKGETVNDAKNVQEHLLLKTNLPLKKGDILRKQIVLKD